MKQSEKLRKLTKGMPVMASIKGFMDGCYMDGGIDPIFMKTMLLMRMKHCEEGFMKNRFHAHLVAEDDIVMWKGGHFSFHTYEAMEEALTQDVEEWNSLIWAEVIIQIGYIKNPTSKDINNLKRALEMRAISIRRGLHA